MSPPLTLPRPLSAFPCPTLPWLSAVSAQRENLAQSTVSAKNRFVFIGMKEEGGSSKKGQFL